MTVLTWRDVDAPDFRGSMDGLELASKSMNAGLNAARGGLDDVEKRQTENQSTALLAKAATYQDPGVLDADLKSGAFWDGFDMKKLNPNDVKAVMSRPGEILAFAKEKTGYDQTQKLIADSDYLRTNARVFNGALVARRQGDKAFQEYYAANKDILEGASGGAFKSFLDNEQDISQGDLSRQGTQLNQLITGTNFRNNEQDRAVELETKSLEGYLLGQAAPGDWLRYTNTNRKALEDKGFSGRAIDNILRQANALAGAGGGSGGGGGGAGGGAVNFDAMIATPDNQSAIVEAAKQLGTSPEDLATVISYETGGKFDPDIVGGKNNNHMGLIQFGIPEREKYGVKPGMGFKAQMASVVAYLKDRGFKPGMGLEDLYSTINAGSPGRYNASDGNGTVSSHVAKMRAEHAGNASAFLGIANPRALQVATDTAIQGNISSSRSAAIARDFQKAWSDNSNADQIAAALTGKDGTFSGENTRYLSAEITRVADKYNLSPAVAASVIQRSTDGQDGVLRRPFSDMFGDGLKIYIDDDKVEQYAKLAGDRKALADATVTIDSQTQVMATNAQTVAQLKAAKASKASKILEAARRGIPADTSIEDALIQSLTSQQDGGLVNAASIGSRGNKRPVDAIPIDRRPATPPRTQAPLILANTAQGQEPAPWAKKALAAVAAAKPGKPLTAAEFAAAMAAQAGKKSLLTR